MNKPIYVFTCGCHLKADERVRGKNKTCQCPRHPYGRFDYFIKQCVDCKTQITPKHPSTVRCKECQTIKNIENDHRAKFKYRYGISIDDYNDEDKAACDAWDCSHRDECLIKHDGKKYLPCLGCEKYEKMTTAEIIGPYRTSTKNYGVGSYL